VLPPVLHGFADIGTTIALIAAPFVHEAGPLEEFPVDRERVDALVDLFRSERPE
jgi:hypothetical protein